MKIGNNRDTQYLKSDTSAKTSPRVFSMVRINESNRLPRSLIWYMASLRGKPSWVKRA